MSRRVPQVEGAHPDGDGWPCHLCPEVFDSLRELHQHNARKCMRPYPAQQWFIDRTAQLTAENADLKARIAVAKKWIGDYNGMWIVLDLRVKNWKSKWDKHWED